MQITVEAHGTKSARDVLADLARRANDARPVWRAVADAVQDAERLRFNLNGQGDWPPLEAITQSTKSRKHLDPRALRASNTLFHSLTEPHARGAVRDFGNRRQMRFGTDLFYAHFHDQGEGVTQRELIRLDERAQRRIAELIGRYLVGDAHLPL